MRKLASYAFLMNFVAYWGHNAAAGMILNLNYTIVSGSELTKFVYIQEELMISSLI